MKTYHLLTLPAFLALTATSLFAAPKGGGKGPPPLPPEVLAKYDTNGDGKLDDTEKAAMKADLEAKRKALIAKYDVDGNGVLDATERAAMEAALEAEHLAELTAKFTALDTDASGDLSLTEFSAGAPSGATAARIQEHFTKLDTDKSGGISLAEFTAKPKPPAKPPGKPAGKK